MLAEPAMLPVNISLASFPAMRHEDAAQAAIPAAYAGELKEELFGAIRADHVQLVPQSFGFLDEDLCDVLMEAYPATQFRLHANLRIARRHTVAEISGLHLHQDWFAQAARISKRLNAPAYTAHSGTRSEASMKEMLENARRLADLFECPVGVEGQYPTDTGDYLLVASWDEYRKVFDSGVPYALDLSHLNILAHQSGSREMGMVKEMLSCERCIEVHVSDNDGSGDWHQVCESKPWWYELMPYINQSAVVFTEGNHRRKRTHNHANAN
jgi:sugar phosphate isomerase/epimerase